MSLCPGLSPKPPGKWCPQWMPILGFFILGFRIMKLMPAPCPPEELSEIRQRAQDFRTIPSLKASIPNPHWSSLVLVLLFQKTAFQVGFQTRGEGNSLEKKNVWRGQREVIPCYAFWGPLVPWDALKGSGTSRLTTTQGTYWYMMSLGISAEQSVLHGFS